jgi:YidC/Oxa1 family membrane protein insertase
MPEIHNPDFESRNPEGIGGVRSLLAFVVVLTLFFGFQYVWTHKSPVTVPANHLQPQTAPAGTAQALPQAAAGQSIATGGKFGWLTFLAEPLYLALRFFHNRCIANWGWSIVVLTVIFNLVLIWPRVMATRSSLKMMRVQPKVDALKKRYAHLRMSDPRREEMNAEMMNIYRAEGTNMFGGCLPSILQLPLLFAYMSVLRNAAELHQAHWLWLTDLSSPDPLHVLPLLIIGSMILTQWITPMPAMNPSQRWMFAVAMPAAAGFWLWHYASGLSLYWFTGNILNLLIQLAINRSKPGKEMRALAAARVRPTA